MSKLEIDFKKTCGSGKEQLCAIGRQLCPEIKRVSDAQALGYDTDYASINVPFDEQLKKTVQRVVVEKQMLQPAVLVVIGIGGSNLGTKAVVEALFGQFYNAQQPDIEIYYADSADSDYINDILLLVEQKFIEQKTVLLNIVSKSGTTTEAMVNFDIFLQLLKSYVSVEWHKYVVITTNEGSPLWQFGKQNKCACLAVPESVGGRYSVFSSVGLFPLALIGVDVAKLCEGATHAVKQGLNVDIFSNPAAVSAAILFANYTEGKNIHNTFVFSKDLFAFGQWYCQLLAESIGKEHNRAGGVVNIGILPTVSVGTIDLHSVVQLYLGGPANVFTTFISVDYNKSDLMVSNQNNFDRLIPNIENKSLSFISNAILQGVCVAYQKKNRPFVHMSLAEKNAFVVGQLLQMKMMEVIYLGFLLDVNPFDQPNVELYKKETRKILAND